MWSYIVAGSGRTQDREGRCELRLQSVGDSQVPLGLAGDWKGPGGAGLRHQPKRESSRTPVCLLFIAV